MDGIFTAASHHDILVLLVQISVLLFTARILGELAQRVGQPSVVGEILAGIVLGPSLLSGVFPVVEEWMVPHTPVQGYLLEVIGMLGVMLLLLITGLETDVALIRSQARSALGVAAGGLIVPLVMGFLLGLVIPESLMVNENDRYIFALFLAIAMAISAIPVVAKVLMDLNLTRRDAGQTIIAAAMIDDSVGWILLSIVIGMASSGGVSLGIVAEAAGSVLVFMAISFTLGYWLVRTAYRFVQNRIQSRDKILSLIIILTFVWGAISQALNLEALLGAFVMGIIFSQISSLDSEVVHKIESMALGIFAPIFFGIAGLKVNILNLLEPELLAVALVVIIVATICKVVGIYIGARLIGKSDHWTAIFYGAGLNARGSMGIIIASIGLSLGLLTQDMFSIIVLMAVVTSLMAPAGLRWALNNMQMDKQESVRLQLEEMNKSNIVANINRVLLPVRLREDQSLRPTHAVEAQIIEKLSAGKSLELTLMTILQGEQNGTEYLTRLSELFREASVSRKIVTSDQPTNAILDEAKKGYNLMMLGASERRPDSQTVFTPVVDSLVRLSPCPTLIIHTPKLRDDWGLKHILVATSGSLAGRRAAQLGFAIGAAADAEVTIVSVVEKNIQNLRLYTSTIEERRLTIAHEIVGELKQVGQLLGVGVIDRVEVGINAETTLLRTAQEEKADLIILGTNVRPGSENLYLGTKVEHILNGATCPVLIFNS